MGVGGGGWGSKSGKKIQNCSSPLTMDADGIVQALQKQRMVGKIAGGGGGERECESDLCKLFCDRKTQEGAGSVCGGDLRP